MVKRKIINIDEEKCNGCGNCVTACKEGAIQIIDGVAKVVNEKFCDGFGDCIGECPTGALEIEEKETEEFDLEATKEHLKNLRGEEAVEDMIEAQKQHIQEENNFSGCPGSKMKFMNNSDQNNQAESQNNETDIKSELQQWPIQIHLLPPSAPYFENADLLVAADCVPVAYGNFQNLLKNKTIALGCPKLDDNDAYVNKLQQIIENNDLNSITVLRMQVPCCGFMVNIVEKALEQADSDLELQVKIISVEGEMISG